MTREEAIERFENVKANALVQKAIGVSEYWQNEIDGTIEAIDMAIEALQTDLVLCKDCKKRGVFGEKGFCELYARGVPDEHYCSYGERREP